MSCGLIDCGSVSLFRSVWQEAYIVLQFTYKSTQGTTCTFHTMFELQQKELACKFFLDIPANIQQMYIIMVSVTCTSYWGPGL